MVFRRDIRDYAGLSYLLDGNHLDGRFSPLGVLRPSVRCLTTGIQEFSILPERLLCGLDTYGH